MIDSIQTMNYTELSSSPGSVTQVRECTNAIMHVAKSFEIPAILVGHVNKDGAIAGPKVLEHIVDAVLYFEGDRQMTYRILRAVKKTVLAPPMKLAYLTWGKTAFNRWTTPPWLCFRGRPVHVSGTCVTCVMEGTRPILAEIQGLARRPAGLATRAVWQLALIITG